MVNIVIDANIIVSALFGGAPLKAVLKAYNHTVYCSREIEIELKSLPDKLKKKLNPSQHLQLTILIKEFLLKTRQVNPKNKISICRDKKDNKYLETAGASKSDFLITGDKDLLEIRAADLKKINLSGLTIISPADFVLLK